MERKRVCFPGSLYVLTFYLLMSSEDQILNTLYYFDKNIPESIRNKFPKVRYLNEPISNRWLLAIKSKLTSWFIYKELFGSDIYA